MRFAVAAWGRSPVCSSDACASQLTGHHLTLADVERRSMLHLLLGASIMIRRRRPKHVQNAAAPHSMGATLLNWAIMRPEGAHHGLGLVAHAPAHLAKAWRANGRSKRANDGTAVSWLHVPVASPPKQMAVHTQHAAAQVQRACMGGARVETLHRC